MKSKFISITGKLVALALIAAATFTYANRQAEPPAEARVAQWFELTPGQDPNEPSSYTKLEDGTEPSCREGDEICAILAEPQATNDELPDMSTVNDSETRFRD